MNTRDPFREQYERWVALYGPELYRYAYGLTGSSARAEDLLQDTFAEAWSSIAGLRETEKVRAWLFQIMRYRFSRTQRQGRSPRKTVALPEEMEQLPMTEARSPLDEMALRESLDNSLMKLSPEIRRTFLMVFLEELTCRETAAVLGVPIGTVLSRLDAARRSLRNAISVAEGRVESGKTIKPQRNAAGRCP